MKRSDEYLGTGVRSIFRELSAVMWQQICAVFSVIIGTWQRRFVIKPNSGLVS